MRICASCFKDVEIQRYINSISDSEVICECCGSSDGSIDIEDLLDFFTEFLELYVSDINGLPIIEKIESEWKIFTDENCANIILSEVILRSGAAYSIGDKVSYQPNITQFQDDWKTLKADVRENRRYFADIANFNWESYIATNVKIKKGAIFYRARIIPNNVVTLKKKEMGCPPKELVTAGRANPIGIPYLYLSRDIETTYYEVRAVFTDRLNIGRFKIERDLDIIDFSSRVNLFVTYSESGLNLVEIVQKKLLFDNISYDLSKPLRRFDTEIEYVPTQLICEYCKINKLDGVSFDSSLHSGGKNIVLFNENDAKCTKILSKRVSKVVLKADNI